MNQTTPSSTSGIIQLLGQKRPRAMAILANYMAVVKYVDSYWWFKGRAEKEISGISRILPEQWQWALHWPLTILESRENVKRDPRTFMETGSNDIHTVPVLMGNGNYLFVR
ncbi:uncharacterized protein Z518_10114 [Rhinocladiella mackenziei CBS 650.93]|uniref:Uncharacterized protein n=1 Tax=Rhinocladiella mackenziei CBS 650.93 TaxID=1442369 RepID=A0A0D2GRZ0_9EURO|nr:uncharacterized protein Z518_10114 [Rhinocladiella mackenziei CBS 650.93]KIX01048.1 hypothetical protein Z518_10114 [Rhinocladiella mackenziei CBS 650.93]